MFRIFPTNNHQRDQVHLPHGRQQLRSANCDGETTLPEVQDHALLEGKWRSQNAKADRGSPVCPSDCQARVELQKSTSLKWIRGANPSLYVQVAFLLFRHVWDLIFSAVRLAKCISLQ